MSTPAKITITLIKEINRLNTIEPKIAIMLCINGSPQSSTTITKESKSFTKLLQQFNEKDVLNFAWYLLRINAKLQALTLLKDYYHCNLKEAKSKLTNYEKDR